MRGDDRRRRRTRRWPLGPSLRKAGNRFSSDFHNLFIRRWYHQFSSIARLAGRERTGTWSKVPSGKETRDLFSFYTQRFNHKFRFLRENVSQEGKHRYNLAAPEVAYQQQRRQQQQPQQIQQQLQQHQQQHYLADKRTAECTTRITKKAALLIVDFDNFTSLKI